MCLKDKLRPLKNQQTAFLFDSFGNIPLTVCAPHHTPTGIKQMPCGRIGDENAGTIAMHLAYKLKCSYMIAVMAHMDPNKADGPYLERISDLKQPIIEIHGHGGKLARFDIEITCGSVTLEHHAKIFAEIFNQELFKSPANISLSVSGDFRKIFFKASRTISLQINISNNQIPLHIELPPHIRKSEPEVMGPFLDALYKSVKCFYL